MKEGREEEAGGAAFRAPGKQEEVPFEGGGGRQERLGASRRPLELLVL